MRKSLLLRKAEGNYEITFHLYYDEVPGHAPENYLIEKDILAPLFDQVAKPKYLIKASRLDIELDDFETAITRYYDLVRNWKATETYVHPTIFRYEPKWVEGCQPSG
jgi:hypothetical protein